MNKTANEFLFEHGINTMKLNDDFNSQLFYAMERYAEQYASQFTSSLSDKEIEKEAERLYPYKQGSEYFQFNTIQLAHQQAHIKARKMGSGWVSDKRELRDITWDEIRELENLPIGAELIERKDYGTHIGFYYRFVHDNHKLNIEDGFSYSSIGISIEPSRLKLSPIKFKYLLDKNFRLY